MALRAFNLAGWDVVWVLGLEEDVAQVFTRNLFIILVGVLASSRRLRDGLEKCLVHKTRPCKEEILSWIHKVASNAGAGLQLGEDGVAQSKPRLSRLETELVGQLFLLPGDRGILNTG